MAANLLCELTGAPCCNEAGEREREASSRATSYAQRRYVVRSERTAAMEDFCAGWNAYEPTKDCDDVAWSHVTAKYGYEGDWEVGRWDFRAGWDDRFAWEQRYQRSA
ncbi:hypothetical protein [Polyangium mundeleinium]|uniref:Uncharacterized protein n=1 Tax=Polyangium mundeleinium TaxID=2995306 RepID=A0ABT5EXW1_9BACT|nr:hypothetical protein [Polyangium mundeleinium]MDC0746674.1 hypothetical protein [Polyangium mundeleinium]